MTVGCSIKVGMLRSRLLQFSNHPPESDDAVAALEQVADHAPIQSCVRPDAHPQSAPIGCGEELLPGKQSLDRVLFETKSDRRASLHAFERDERLPAGSKVRMTP